jgi:hypothetical protein
MGTSNKDTWHDTQVFYLTYFLKVTQVKVQNVADMVMYYLTYNILTLCEHVSSAITSELIAGSAPNFYI